MRGRGMHGGGWREGRITGYKPAPHKSAPWRAFTLIELLVVVAILAVLVSILLPGLQAAKARARAAVCGSNIRQLAAANLGYATEYNGRLCPGAPGMRSANLVRWHGVRTSASEPFDAALGPLAPHLGGESGVRVCPEFREAPQFARNAFEEGTGGYGYNQAYLGRIMRMARSGSFRVLNDAVGVQIERVRRPGETLMFADTAFAAEAETIIEYSFAEPRFHPEYLRYEARPDPSIHFRHRGDANVAWTDGHVDRRSMTFTWSSGVYAGDPAAQGIGWFGAGDDNGFFDLE